MATVTHNRQSLGLPPLARSDVIFAFMESSSLKRMDVEAAKQDLKNRTLLNLGYDFARLMYLSSLRDFSTGEYYHHGLAQSFSEAAATAAITACHEEFFYGLTLGPLDSFVAQLDRLIISTRKDYKRTLEAWETLGAYKVAVPSTCDPTVARLFKSNVKIAMMFLKRPGVAQEEKFQPASLPQLPDR